MTTTVSASSASAAAASSTVAERRQRERLALADEERVDVLERSRRPAGVGPAVVVAAGDVAERAFGDDEQLVEARSDGTRRLRGDVGQLGARARIDRDHRPVAAERQHDGRRRPRRRPGCDPLDALVGKRPAHEIAGDVLAERRCDGRVDPEPRGGDRGDGAAAGGADHVGRELLLPERGQRLEPHEREVEEDRGRDDELQHALARIQRRQGGDTFSLPG